MFNLFSSNTLPELFWHTDVHSHVCPGIDDGAHSPQLAVQLVRGMSELGFRSMVVTPHVTDETFPNTPEIISGSFRTLRNACREAGLDMELNCSAEYRIDEILYDMLAQDTVSPLPGRWLLVENSWFQEPFGLKDFLFGLVTDHHLRPIMAHPERFGYYQRHRERLEELSEAGIHFQVNLLSLAGHYGRHTKQLAEWLLSHDMVQFVGSDLHRQGHLDIIRRYLCSRDYRRLEARADLILNDRLLEEAGA